MLCVGQRYKNMLWVDHASCSADSSCSLQNVTISCTAMNQNCTVLPAARCWRHTNGNYEIPSRRREILSFLYFPRSFQCDLSSSGFPTRVASRFDDPWPRLRVTKQVPDRAECSAVTSSSFELRTWYRVVASLLRSECIQVA